MSIVLISRFKNERHILYEWVHHHIAEGVDKIILIDDKSDDNYLKVNDWLDQYIQSGYIEVHKSELDQKDDYNRFLPDLRKYAWVVQIDMDEFVFCPSLEITLKEMLEHNYSDVDYIRINWKLFQHKSTYQPKSVIADNLTTHLEDKDPSSPVGVKCIAKTKYLSNIKIHRCEFSRRVETVSLTSHNFDIQINHYRTQSDEFVYGVKEQRGAGANKDSYIGKKLKNKVDINFAKQDFVLQTKRTDLINKCNSRLQIRPKVYINSSWLKGLMALGTVI